MINPVLLLFFFIYILLLTISYGKFFVECGLQDEAYPRKRVWPNYFSVFTYLKVPWLCYHFCENFCGITWTLLIDHLSTLVTTRFCC